MQSNIFVKVEPLLKEKKFDIDYNSVIAFLNHYHQDDWIYPDAMHRNCKINIKQAYEILEQYLQIYCPRCQRFTGNYYKTVFDIPTDINCVHCAEDVEQPLKHVIIIYKVL